MIDEASRRLPSWDEDAGEWVTMADGREWLVPRPSVTFRPRRVEGKPTLDQVSSFGPEFDAEVRAMRMAEPLDFVAMALCLGADLLRRAYDLTDDEANGLLEHRADDEASQDRIRSIVAVANGGSTPPKPSPGGSA